MRFSKYLYLPYFQVLITVALIMYMKLPLVRQVRLELTRDCSHHPLKVARLPFRHCRIKQLLIGKLPASTDRIAAAHYTPEGVAVIPA